MVEFFNPTAATRPALATLAPAGRGDPVFALPLPDGRFRMIYELPVEMPAADSADPVRELTQRCTDVLEMYVRRHPNLWLWMHRRWRELDGSQAPVAGMFPRGAEEAAEE
jgi:KDO2-lipid IV(A) lauroyltransferase